MDTMRTGLLSIVGRLSLYWRVLNIWYNWLGERCGIHDVVQSICICMQGGSRQFLPSPFQQSGALGLITDSSMMWLYRNVI